MILDVFDKITRKRIDIITIFSYVSYTNNFVDVGTFEIRVPILNECTKSLVEGNYILFEKDICGIIKRRMNTIDNEEEIIVSGYLSKHFLQYRSFLLTTEYYDYPSNIAFKMVNDLLINPENPKRKIDFIFASEDNHFKPITSEKIRVQNTGDELQNVLAEMFMPIDFGFDLIPLLNNCYNGIEANIKGFEFRVYKPVNRSIDSDNPVVFSFELNNLSSILFDENNLNYKNVAIVAAEGEGSNRHIIETGDVESEGLNRIELYVDARDLQPQEGESTEQLESKMKQRGGEKLSETKKMISFDATINTGDSKFIYNKDYFLGDFVTIYSKELNKTVNVQIIGITKSISGGVENLDVTFGYDSLSIKKIFK